jgi:hypothetical protein
MTPLGKTEDRDAREFVRLHEMSRLGSMTGDGFRRVVTEAVGDQLERQREAFVSIATSVATLPEPVAVIEPVIVPCSHRGSQRHTCCGSPNLWICRHHKVAGSFLDCVATMKDKQSLLSMVPTTEASTLLTCDTCKDRLDTNKQAT